MALMKNDPRRSRGKATARAKHESPLKATVVQQQNAILRDVRRKMAQGRMITPLQFMLAVLNSEETLFKHKMWAAKEAAPYVHRRMPQAIETTQHDAPIRTAAGDALRKLTDEELEVAMKMTAVLASVTVAEENAELASLIDGNTGQVVGTLPKITAEDVYRLPGILDSDGAEERPRLKKKGSK